VVVLPRREPLADARQRVLAMLPELEGISDFRLANERSAAERAATRVADADLDYLEGTIADLRASDSIDAFRRADSRFHLRIAAVADCALLRAAVEDGRVAMFLPLDVLDFELLLTTSVRAHARILAALRERSPDKAGRAMAAHIRTTWDELRAGVGAPAGPGSSGRRTRRPRSGSR
jgi:GntR family transcriptional regulator, transcriptional repressor for pyruvate dehydrogenase complex